MKYPNQKEGWIFGAADTGVPLWPDRNPGPADRGGSPSRRRGWEGAEEGLDTPQTPAILPVPREDNPPGRHRGTSRKGRGS
eukprot:1196090-Prorocentrum_minimum.AAC.1